MQHKFKILKNKNNQDEIETIRIEAISNDKQSSIMEQKQQHQEQQTQLFAFDSSKGSIEIINLNETSETSTDKLNRQNLYNLLLKLRQNDQLILNYNDSHLTSQFFLNTNEIDNLFNNESVAVCESNENNVDDLASLEITSLLPSIRQPFVCQEICCLLKFTALDE